MGLISKIEEKITGTPSSNPDANKLEKSNHESSSTGGTNDHTSKLQNPIGSSSSGPTGSAIDPHSGNVTSQYAQNTGNHSSSSGDRMPGSFVNDESHHPSGTTSSSRTAPNQPIDPYSSKGQETAARAGTTGTNGSTVHTAGTTGHNVDDPSISRSKDGGVLNQKTEQPYGSHTSSNTGTTDSHHHGRDAAAAGGAGALGAGALGAHEMNKGSPASQPLMSSSGHPDHSSTTSSNHPGQSLTSSSHQPGHTSHNQDVSYMHPGQQQHDHAGHNSSTGQHSGLSSSGPGITTTGAHNTGSHSSSGATSGLTQGRKTGGSYEDGYKDAMEHMQEAMRHLVTKLSGQSRV